MLYNINIEDETVDLCNRNLINLAHCMVINNVRAVVVELLLIAYHCVGQSHYRRYST